MKSTPVPPADEIMKSMPKISLSKPFLVETEVLRLLQIEKNGLEQLIAEDKIHIIYKENLKLFSTAEVVQLRAQTMELDTIQMDKREVMANFKKHFRPT